jgi:hypothetical protein
MPGLSFANIESELSYAYLHAVAARAGVACTVMGRHEDNVAIDAKLTGWGNFPGGTLTEVEINVQLKATIAIPTDNGNTYSYSIRKSGYSHLRAVTKATPRLLVVLFLPRDNVDWLLHGEDQLVVKRCAYWVSLWDAPDIPPDQDSTTIYIPKTNIFNPDGLRDIMARLSRFERLTYAGNF